jgi:NitT/TauT family transport system substrate-binding protein
MAKFRIMPHGRLQEWVAEEKAYFKDEGLEYEFVRGGRLERGEPTVQRADGAPAQVITGAFESMEAGRACEVSSACHWAVNMASSAQHGLMWGHAYSVTPSAILVANDSPIRKPQDLRDVEIGVGYHSGSHFSCLQAIDPFIGAKNAKLRFIGGPGDRLDLMVEGKMQAVNVFGIQKDVLEQLGFHKIVDTTFMIGFLIGGDASVEEVQKYFNALQRAQRDVDIEPERYKHYFLKEMPDKYKSKVDVRGFSTGERIVFEPYTREMYERTHRWMEDLELFPAEQLGKADYAEAVMT